MCIGKQLGPIKNKGFEKQKFQFHYVRVTIICHRLIEYHFSFREEWECGSELFFNQDVDETIKELNNWNSVTDD